MNDIFKLLKAPFPPELISWRVGATNAKKNNGKATKGIALAYIDARDVMDRLDTVVGPGNWQNSHPHANGKTSCRIGIKIGDEWVWKENGAGDSAMDAEKGAFSDSFKRAAVLWGIGQYLYNVPNIWVDLDQWGKISNPHDPRLAKALKEAASGIRGQSEPEPEDKPKPVDEAEYAILKTGVAEAPALPDLKEAINKIIAAGDRLNQAQKDSLNSEYKSRLSFLSQAPLETKNGAVQ